MEFTYKFDYTKTENRNTITGYAYGKFFVMKVRFFQILLPTTKTSTSVEGFSAGDWLPTKM